MPIDFFAHGGCVRKLIILLSLDKPEPIPAGECQSNPYDARLPEHSCRDRQASGSDVGRETSRSTHEQRLSYGRLNLAELQEVLPLLARAAVSFLAVPDLNRLRRDFDTC